MTKPTAQKDDASMDVPADVMVQAEEEALSEPWGFTRSHRVGLGIVTGVMVVLLGITLWQRPARLDAPPATGPSASLPARVNPNTASWEELARVPRLGEAMAKKIVAYREKQREAGNRLVFEKIEDIDRVPGIGAKTLDGFRAYLDFPADRPADLPMTTQPATTQKEPDVEVEPVVVPGK